MCWDDSKGRAGTQMLEETTCINLEKKNHKAKDNKYGSKDRIENSCKRKRRVKARNSVLGSGTKIYI